MVKSCLLAFNLNSLHYIELINDRAHLSLAKGIGEEVANTTKQMKKQMLNKGGEKKAPLKVDWKCLKLILELMQACLVNGDLDEDDDEQKMDVNNNEIDESMKKLYESFIQLIPYLFLILETIEENFDADITCKEVKSDKEEQIVE
jgi:hypothetical protein